jgi:hypothetical protein
MVRATSEVDCRAILDQGPGGSAQRYIPAGFQLVPVILKMWDPVLEPLPLRRRSSVSAIEK